LETDGEKEQLLQKEKQLIIQNKEEDLKQFIKDRRKSILIKQKLWLDSY